jgi:hypothetical protein
LVAFEVLPSAFQRFVIRHVFVGSVWPSANRFVVGWHRRR